MIKIIAALVSAIQFVLATRSTISALTEEIVIRDEIIADLRDQVASDTVDDAELEARVVAAEESLYALQVEIDAANEKADELAKAITNDPEIPVTIDDGEVVADDEEVVEDDK